MCDTLVVRSDGQTLFAKNSDRDANEAQLLTWSAASDHPPGAAVGCTHIEVPQVERTHAVLISRPFWMWGGEMGANEHGVVIGNEAVFTRRAVADSGLLGMDLIRLALERADTARTAVDTLVALLEAHGQGGRASLEDPAFRYHNSFLIADGTAAFVLETADRHWAVEEVAPGARSISNGLTIPAFRAAHTERVKTAVAAAARRQRRTCALATGARDPADLLPVLQDHGGGVPRYRWLNGTLGAPCMHGGGVVASSVTTASWISRLPRDGPAEHWVTATAAPCLALYKPVRVSEPLDLGADGSDRADDSRWWRHEELHRRVLRDPERLGALFLAERDAVQARWFSDPPEPADAFAEEDELLARWLGAVRDAGGPDRRPWWARRYWARRDRQAGRTSP